MTAADPNVIRDALDLGLQAWRTTPVRDKFFSALAALDALEREADSRVWQDAIERLERELAAVRADLAAEEGVSETARRERAEALERVFVFKDRAEAAEAALAEAREALRQISASEGENWIRQIARKALKPSEGGEET